MSSRTTPNFCSRCGASLSPGDAYCSQCGSDVSTDAKNSAGRTTTGSTGAPSSTERTTASGRTTGPSGQRRTDLRRRVEDLAVEGWDVKHDDGHRVVMVNRGIGSVVVHALLLATTSGVGNLLYAWYCYSPGAEQRVLRAGGTERRSVTDRRSTWRGPNSTGWGPSSTGWDPKTVVGVVAGLSFAGLLALTGLLVLWLASSLALTGLGLALWFTGVASVPLVTQFAPGFESPTTFGRRRTTDERVVVEPTIPCSACSRPVGTGVERTFAEKRYLAGIPVETLNEGRNSYCRSCANGDPFVRGSATDREKSREFA